MNKRVLKENTDPVSAIAKAGGATGTAQIDAVKTAFETLSKLINEKPNLKQTIIQSITDNDFKKLQTALVSTAKEGQREEQAPAAGGATPPAQNAAAGVQKESRRRTNDFVSYLFN